MSDLSTHKNNTYLLLSCLLLTIAAIFYASFDSLVEMERIWGSKEEYGYAYMIPLITGFFIWQRLDKLAENSFELNWLGGVVLLAALSVILLGTLSATHSITQYGAIVAVIAAAYLYLGSAALRIIIAPMLLLLLVVPLPPFLFNNLSGFLQLVSSELGVLVIRAFGISVFLEGNVIDLGTFQLQVVEACSGLRYLFPLFSLSLIAAFLYNAEFWKRTVVVLSSLPITVFMNSFRIGVIGVLVEYKGIDQAEGFLHDFEGWFVFMACTFLLIFEMWILLKIGSGNKKLSEAFALEVPENKDITFKTAPINIKHIGATVIAIVLGILIGLVNEREELIPDRQMFVTFPLEVDGWKGKRGSIEPVVLDFLKLDDYFMADYADGSGGIVNFYIAYYQSQRTGQTAHSPKSCIPGGGWKIKNLSTESVGTTYANKEKKVNRMLITKGDNSQLVYYWFPQRGRIITNEYMVKWYLFWDSLTLNRTDGALVRLTIPLTSGDLAAAEKRMAEFLDSVEPELSRYLPE